MIDRKLQVHYNPANPQEWYLANEYIEGCRIGQKIEQHFFGYPPT